jgi:hypothetical protein
MKLIIQEKHLHLVVTGLLGNCYGTAGTVLCITTHSCMWTLDFLATALDHTVLEHWWLVLIAGAIRRPVLTSTTDVVACHMQDMGANYVITQ